MDWTQVHLIYTNLQWIWEFHTETCAVSPVLSYQGAVSRLLRSRCLCRKENCWLLCRIPVLKLMSSSVWENWLPTRSQSGSQWFLTVCLSSTVPCQFSWNQPYGIISYWQGHIPESDFKWMNGGEKKSCGKFWYTVAAAFQLLKELSAFFYE